MEDDDDESAGWEAINQALEAIYPEQEPLHYGTVLKYMLGGPDPIDGVSVYRSEKGCPHWHYVTFGFTELYSKESESLEYSGFGFELTMRLKRDPSSDEPPAWPVGLMQNLARYVFETGSVFAPGHYIDCNGEIALDTGTELKAVIFVSDPELPEIQTPNGKMRFIQMVGVTLDELQAAKNWNTLGLAGLIAERDPFLVIDLARKSWMIDSSIAQKVKEGIAKEGSSTGSLFVTQLESKTGLMGGCRITIGAIAVEDLRTLVSARLGHGHELVLIGQQRAVEMQPAEKFSCKETKNGLLLNLTPADVARLATGLECRAGDYRINDKFEVTIIKTEVTDAQGRVTEVLG